MVHHIVKLLYGNFIIKLIGLNYDDGVEEPISPICVDASELQVLDSLRGKVGNDGVVMKVL